MTERVADPADIFATSDAMYDAMVRALNLVDGALRLPELTLVTDGRVDLIP